MQQFYSIPFWLKYSDAFRCFEFLADTSPSIIPWPKLFQLYVLLLLVIPIPSYRSSWRGCGAFGLVFGRLVRWKSGPLLQTGWLVSECTCSVDLCCRNRGRQEMRGGGWCIREAARRMWSRWERPWGQGSSLLSRHLFLIVIQSVQGLVWRFSRSLPCCGGSVCVQRIDRHRLSLTDYHYCLFPILSIW